LVCAFTVLAANDHVIIATARTICFQADFIPILSSCFYDARICVLPR
jgi:hypothetical protein